MARKTADQAEESFTLTLDLFAPGMTAMHRAGLGGLVCSLRAMERDVQARKYKGDLPAGKWEKEGPPWKIEETKVQLKIGKAEDARDWLKALFEYSFQVSEDEPLFFLPGQYGATPPPVSVRAYLQSGITLSFLQHGQTRKLARKATTKTYQLDGDKKATISYEFKALDSYKHQSGWKDLTDSKGRLVKKPIEVVGPLSPGAVVRHNAFAGPTKLKEPPSLILPLYFSIVGCLALSINRGSGVLLVPDVENLLNFPVIRRAMTPTTIQECQISAASDAALQTQLRIRAEKEIDGKQIPACYLMTFQPTVWASQQKSRVATETVLPPSDSALDQFKIALNELSPRVLTREIEEPSGRGEKKVVKKRQESFWVDSIVRPLVATNLARDQPWYSNFVDLYIKADPVSKHPLRTKLPFEKKGLSKMIKTIPWNDTGESAIVNAVHDSIRRRYAIIATESKTNSAAMKNRWNGEYDRWRLAFAGAKTSEQFRRSLCDLFSRAGGNPSLQQDWQAVLPMLSEGRWQQSRDLALLGLASYSGNGAKEIDAADQKAGDTSEDAA